MPWEPAVTDPARAAVAAARATTRTGATRAPASQQAASQGALSATTDQGPVVLYDGVCGLCNHFVQFVLRRDRAGRFRFAPLQGPFAVEVLARHGLRAPDAPDSIVLLDAPGTGAERARVRSDAVLSIVAGLGGGWRLTALLRVIPPFLRDAVYALVARVRYRLFGRFDRCALPPPNSKHRFLD